MRKVRMGKTGLMVSRVGMGGIPITRPQENEAVKVIQRALDLGVNFFDTASGYGLGSSERRIGKAVTGRRDRVIIATKTGSVTEVGASRSLERSLRQLNTDYIDLWQLGNVTTFDKYEKLLSSDGGLKAAKEASRLGKVRTLGITTHNMAVAVEAVSSGLFETIQFPFNLIADEAAEELVPLSKEHDVGFIASKPFAAGHIKEANLAIKFLLQFDDVVPDPGIETIEELEEIVGIVNGSWDLTPRERRAIGEIHEKMESRFCRHCEECLPCPHGVHIPQLLYLTAAYKLRSTEWFRRRVEAHLKSWEECDLCGDCEEKCPYNLPIREMIAENVEFCLQVCNGDNPQ
jgi:aryl-alcohol dehydrogenase-like predicted oxidoreductase